MFNTPGKLCVILERQNVECTATTTQNDTQHPMKMNHEVFYIIMYAFHKDVLDVKQFTTLCTNTCWVTIQKCPCIRYTGFTTLYKYMLGHNTRNVHVLGEYDQSKATYFPFPS